MERPGEATMTERLIARLRIDAVARLPQVRIGALVALAVVAGLLLWLLVRGNGGSTQTKAARAHAVSIRNLAALPSTVHHPVYWIGPQPGDTYELTLTTAGLIYIRYLPPGVAVGTRRAYLTVGTYPVKDAQNAVRAIAKRLHVSPVALRGGGLAVQDTKHPSSVYVAYPGSDYEVEVFDPSPARARQVALSGYVSELGASAAQTAATKPKAVNARQLGALQSSVGHPVYWLGAQPATTYELSETGDGKIYVRYLPRGTKVGDPRPHTTVGTYPLRDPIAAVKRIAKQTGGRTFSIAGGGVAAVDAKHPTSVYVAFPGSNYEIEVFDPSATRARRLVSSGRVLSVH
jgi:hypothetical protein